MKYEMHLKDFISSNECEQDNEIASEKLERLDSLLNIFVSNLIDATYNQEEIKKVTTAIKSIRKHLVKIQDIINQPAMQLFLDKTGGGFLPSVWKDNNSEINYPARYIILDKPLSQTELNDLNDLDPNRKHDIRSITEYFFAKIDTMSELWGSSTKHGGRPVHPICSPIKLSDIKTEFLARQLRYIYDEIIPRSKQSHKQNYRYFAIRICEKIEKDTGITLGIHTTNQVRDAIDISKKKHAKLQRNKNWLIYYDKSQHKWCQRLYQE